MGDSWKVVGEAYVGNPVFKLMRGNLTVEPIVAWVAKVKRPHLWQHQPEVGHPTFEELVC